MDVVVAEVWVNVTGGVIELVLEDVEELVVDDIGKPELGDADMPALHVTGARLPIVTEKVGLCPISSPGMVVCCSCGPCSAK